MKKVLMLMGLILFIASPCFGAGAESSVSEITTQNIFPGVGHKIVTIQWEANASAGVSDYVCASVAGLMLDKVVTDPDGTTAPTANYDIVMNDAYVLYEVTGDKLLNRSATAVEETQLYRQAGMYGSTVIGESGVSISVMNNAVANAVGKIHLYVRHKEGE